MIEYILAGILIVAGLWLTAIVLKNPNLKKGAK